MAIYLSLKKYYPDNLLILIFVTQCLMNDRQILYRWSTSALPIIKLDYLTFFLLYEFFLHSR
jgi:hypothetical protein